MKGETNFLLVITLKYVTHVQRKARRHPFMGSWFWIGKRVKGDNPLHMVQSAYFICSRYKYWLDSHSRKQNKQKHYFLELV